MASATASTSALVEVCPRLKRSVPRARSGSVPVARRTWLGWATPAVQAEPVEHSMPWASSSSSRESPSQPGKVKWALAGRRSVRVAAEDRVRDGRTHGLDEFVAQCADLAGEVLAPLRGDAAGHGEGGDRGGVQGAGADVALLAAAVQDGDGGVLASEQQRADAVRAADLVPGHGHRGQSRRGEVDVELAEGLDRVGVQRDVELPCHGGRVRPPA